MEKLSRITFDPAVMGGKACIRDLRVTVGTVVGLLAAGRSHEEILKAYPYLEREDIDQALAYAWESKKYLQGDRAKESSHGVRYMWERRRCASVIFHVVMEKAHLFLLSKVCL